MVNRFRVSELKERVKVKSGRHCGAMFSDLAVAHSYGVEEVGGACRNVEQVAGRIPNFARGCRHVLLAEKDKAPANSNLVE